MQSYSQKIHIHIDRQSLELLDEKGRLVKSYPISSSSHGLGSESGSFKTPTGRFVISEKIGEGALPWAVFKARILTGEIGSAENPEDLIQTRILWLHGLEQENANTHERYIYIHGTNHESRIGTPASHGCIRMLNTDVIELFNAVALETEVQIDPTY